MIVSKFITGCKTATFGSYTEEIQQNIYHQQDDEYCQHKEDALIESNAFISDLLTSVSRRQEKIITIFFISIVIVFNSKKYHLDFLIQKSEKVFS